MCTPWRDSICAATSLCIYHWFNSSVTNCIIVTCFVVLSKLKKIPLWSLFLIVYSHLQWNSVLTQIMLCLAEAVLRNGRFFFCVNPSTRKVNKTCEALLTFNFSAKYLSKKESSTMLPQLTEFVPATGMRIIRKVLLV